MIVKKHDRRLITINDYNLYLGPKSPNGMVRLVVYVHKDVKYKLRQDLNTPEINSLWFEAGLPHQKKILINQVYRE